MSAAPGWYPDPTRRKPLRYWDGETWTTWAAEAGITTADVVEALEQFPDPHDAPPPPGHSSPPPAHGSAPPEPFRALRALSTALTSLLAVTIVTAIGMTLLVVRRINLLDDVDRGAFVSRDDLESVDTAVAATAVWTVLLGVAVFVVLVVFLFRASKNTALWSPAKARWGPGWTIGGWFIPIAAAVIPGLVAAEIWRRSQPPDDSGMPTPAGEQRASAGIVWAWWTCSIVGALLWQVDAGDSLSELRLTNIFIALGSLAWIPASMLLLFIVRRITSYQHERVERAAVGATTTATPLPWERR